MSAITIDDDLVHFEVLGRGKPVILLHGWLGSWRYWVPAMRQLSGKYRTYAIDLWGFGDTARDPQRYTFDAQVGLLKEFMDRMGIKKAALVGHDFGGSVATRFATQNPDRVPRMMLVAPPLFWLAPTAVPLTANPSLASPPALGRGPSPAFTEAETVPWRGGEMKARLQYNLERQVLAAQQSAPATPEAPKSPRDAATPPTDQPVREITEPPSLPPTADSAMPTESTSPALPEMPRLDYVPGPGTLRMQLQNPLRDHLKGTDRFKWLEDHVEDGPDRAKLRVEVEKADPLAITTSIEGFGTVDTLRELRALSLPVLVLHGKADTFHKHPEPRMIEVLTFGRTTCAVLSLNGIKHFPMLEEQAGFNRLVMEFLEAIDVRQVKPAELWERRVR